MLPSPVHPHKSSGTQLSAEGAEARHFTQVPAYSVYGGTPGPEHLELGDDLANGPLWLLFNLCSPEQCRRSSILETNDLV